MDALADLWSFLTTADNWWGTRGIVNRTWEHVRISVLAVLLATAIALPPAVLLGHVKRFGAVAVTIVNIGRAIPSFAILALTFPLFIEWGFGLGFWPTFTALVVLGIPPIFTNTYTGVRGVSPEIVEAADGVGMRPHEVVLRVELPSAAPLVITGLRISAVQIVATATLGALVGFQALGSFIVEGLAQFDEGKILGGALLVAVLAIATEVGFSAAERALTPWARRGPAATTASTRRSRRGARSGASPAVGATPS
ncbi:MAG TPA: ABC transporter permease [Acidimicrobiales bacterium]|nr:ABC transporter permease [Acidimicrobiales bacterium]